MKVSIDWDERYPDYIVSYKHMKGFRRHLDLPAAVVFRFFEAQASYDAATEALKQAMIAAQPGQDFP